MLAKQWQGLHSQPTQCDTLANTNDCSASDEKPDGVERSKSLHKCSDNGQEATNTHAPSSSKSISLVDKVSEVASRLTVDDVTHDGATKEETSNNCTNGIGGVDCANELSVLGLRNMLAPQHERLETRLHTETGFPNHASQLELPWTEL